jgi:hypothetical protein
MYEIAIMHEIADLMKDPRLIMSRWYLETNSTRWNRGLIPTLNANSLNSKLASDYNITEEKRDKVARFIGPGRPNRASVKNPSWSRHRFLFEIRSLPLLADFWETGSNLIGRSRDRMMGETVRCRIPTSQTIVTMGLFQSVPVRCGKT